MAAPIALITIAQMRDYVDISANLPQAYMLRHIGGAQTQYIRPLLGDTLYETLETEYNTSSLTTENQALLDELVPLITFRAYQIYMTHAGLYNTPMGPREYKEENSEALNEEQIGRLQRYNQGQAESYTQQVLRFLRTNKTNYPTWVDDCEELDIRYTANIRTLRRPDRNDWRPELGTGRRLRKNP